jgi:uncharacterized membrane protein (UPF0127 family)
VLLLAACYDAGSQEPAPGSAAPAADAMPRVRVSVGMHVFDAEVADTPERKSRGLGGHAPLGPGEGMVFAYERPGLYAFWMKGMTFDIDIVWIHGDRVVGISHDVPYEWDSARPPVYRPPEPADLILELGAGVARSKGLQIGDPVRVEPKLRGGTDAAS